MLKDLIRTNRSYRRFHAKVAIDLQTLRELTELARLTPSAGNRQPLKYVLSCSRASNELIFQHLTWAVYLKSWKGPAEGERPSAYIVILGDRNLALSFGYDAGIAAQTILLGAVERGFGGCIIAFIDRDKLKNALELPDHLEILLVLALGEPAEEVVIEPMGADGRVEYWRDEKGLHHVPKRALDELIFKQLA